MKTKATILIDEKVLEKAHEIGLNVSKTCEYALTQIINSTQTLNFQPTSFLGEASFAKEGSLVRSPRFEPGSSAWQADVLDQARLRPHIYGLETFCRGSYFPFLNTASGHSLATELKLHHFLHEPHISATATILPSQVV